MVTHAYTPAFGRLRQEDWCEFKADLGQLVSSDSRLQNENPSQQNKTESKATHAGTCTAFGSPREGVQGQPEPHNETLSKKKKTNKGKRRQRGRKKDLH